MSVGLDDLIQRARALIGTGRRVLLGITGTPGAGKSTLCAALLDALGEEAVLVGMDGFHFANQELVRLGRRDRKGAPDTFDVDGYTAYCGGCANHPTPRFTPPSSTGKSRSRSAARYRCPPTPRW